jgi:hypothetical protein
MVERSRRVSQLCMNEETEKVYQKLEEVINIGNN